MVGLLALNAENLRRDERLLAASSKENLYWTVAQAEIELLRFLNELGRFELGDPGVSAAGLRERFDILWSRAHTFDGGDVGRRMRAQGDVGAKVDALKGALERVDPIMQRLRSPATAAEIAAVLSPFVVTIRGVATHVMQAEEQRFAELRRGVSQNHTITLASIVVMLIVGLLLIGTLLFEIRRSRHEAAAAEELALRARAASDAKQRFLEHVNHELRTPLNGLLGMVALARRGELDAESARCLEHAERCGIALDGMLAAALGYSDTGRAKTRSFVIGRLGCAVGDLLGAEAANAGRTLRVDLGDRTDQRARGYEPGIRIAACALATAALRARGVDQAELRIELSQGGALVLTVTARGPSAAEPDAEALERAAFIAEMAGAAPPAVTTETDGFALRLSLPADATDAPLKVSVRALSSTTRGVLEALTRRYGAVLEQNRSRADVLVVEVGAESARGARASVHITDHSGSRRIVIPSPVDPVAYEEALTRI